MQFSKIFTDAELQSLNKRLDGKKDDKTGIYAMRVKPKIIEIIEWFKQKRKLERLLK
jgi:hypothetical protein